MSDDARDPLIVRKALAARAAVSFPRWEARGQWKDPDRLYQSFLKRLTASRTLNRLVRSDAIPEGTTGEILRLLVSLYDDPTIPTLNPPEWRAEARRKLESRSRRARKRATLLEKEAAEIPDPDSERVEELKAEAWDLRHGADQAQAVIARYGHLARPGNPLIRERGRPTKPSSTFVRLAARLIFEAYGRDPEAPRLGEAEVMSLLDDLASEFWTDSTRLHLQARRRRAAWRRRKRQSEAR